MVRVKFRVCFIQSAAAAGPEEQGGEVIGIGPTRQQLDKKKVMRAREKAARALFQAERLTQEYCAVYGEDTDWEEEDEEEEEEE